MRRECGDLAPLMMDDGREKKEPGGGRGQGSRGQAKKAGEWGGEGGNGRICHIHCLLSPSCFGGFLSFFFFLGKCLLVSRRHQTVSVSSRYSHCSSKLDE